MTNIRTPFGTQAPLELGRKVLLVEDDPLIRECLAGALQGAGYEVRAEPDGAKVERAMTAFRPDIILLDMHLGSGVDGIVVARRLRALGSAPFLFITGDRSPERVDAAFAAGSEDYISKPFVMTELLARMRVVLRRQERSRSVLEAGDLVIDEEAHLVARAGVPLVLTNREFRLLVSLCRHQGRVLSKVQLLTLAWGFEHYDLNVVEVHMSALRRKLEEHGDRLIHTVRNVGYVLRPA